MIAPLLAALSRPLSAPSSRVELVTHRRARLACLLCEALHHRTSPAVARLHRESHALCRVLARRDDVSDEGAERERGIALAVRDRVLPMHAADRTPVLVAIVRELLADAPACCVALDRAVRDAARHHAHTVTADHERAALAVLAQEVLRG